MIVLSQAPVMPDPATIPELTPGQHSYEDVRLRIESNDIMRKHEVWDRLSTIATGGLAAVTLAGIVFAWWKTGKIPGR